MGLRENGPPAPARTPVPHSLVVARWWWVATALAALGFAASFFHNSTQRPPAEAPGLWAAGLVLVGIGLLVGFAVVQLWRGKLAARMSLTWCGLIIGLPLMTRGLRLGIFAGLVLVGVALLWTPGSTRFFAPQARAARAARRAERKRARAR